MRNRSFLLFAVLALGGGGCGGKNTPDGPPSLTPDQIEAANREQKKADDEERAHRKTDPSDKKGYSNSVDEEANRARSGR